MPFPGFQTLLDKKLGLKLGLFSQNFRAKIRIFNAVFKQNSEHHHDVSNRKAFTSAYIIHTDKVTGDLRADRN